MLNFNELSFKNVYLYQQNLFVFTHCVYYKKVKILTTDWNRIFKTVTANADACFQFFSVIHSLLNKDAHFSTKYVTVH